MEQIRQSVKQNLGCLNQGHILSAAKARSAISRKKRETASYNIWLPYINEKERRIAPLRINPHDKTHYFCAGRSVTPAMAAMSLTVNCFAVT